MKVKCHLVFFHPPNTRDRYRKMHVDICITNIPPRNPCVKRNQCGVGANADVKYCMQARIPHVISNGRQPHLIARPVTIGAKPTKLYNMIICTNYYYIMMNLSIYATSGINRGKCTQGHGIRYLPIYLL